MDTQLPDLPEFLGDNDPQGAYLVLAHSEVPLFIEVGRRYDLMSAHTIVGTTKKADIQISSAASYEYEVLIYKDGDSWFFENNTARNDTFLNGYPSRESLLRDGDFLRVGQTILQFLAGTGLQSDVLNSLSRSIRVDSHTGAYNKKFFWESLEKWISFATRHKQSLSLLIVDVDFFKKLNTDYGHLAADFVLKELAKLIWSRLRKEDIFCRFGGEEFTLILPETTQEKALHFASTIRKAVQEYEVTFRDSSFIRITVSIGVATYQLGEDKDAFFIRADNNLLTAKLNGRNQVVG